MKLKMVILQCSKAEHRGFAPTRLYGAAIEPNHCVEVVVVGDELKYCLFNFDEVMKLRG
jgi:hypothetical protein